MIFIDSNIWCYYFDSSSKEHKKVAEYIDSVLGKREIAMNTLVIMEISHYLIKTLGSINGREKINRLLEFPFIIEDFNYNLLLDSVDLLSQYTYTGIGGRDSSILATMKKLGIKQLASHDHAFKKIDFIDVFDPVE